MQQTVFASVRLEHARGNTERKLGSTFGETLRKHRVFSEFFRFLTKVWNNYTFSLVENLQFREV